MSGLLAALAQAVPDPTGLPVWITGGGVLGVLGWLLYRSEHARTEESKRYDAARGEWEKRLDAQRAEFDRRLDASEERYRTMADRYAGRTYEAAAALGQATDTIRSLADRDDRGRAR